MILYKERGISCSSSRLGEIRAVMPSTSCQLEFSRRVKKSLTNEGHTQLASSEDTLSPLIVAESTDNFKLGFYKKVSGGDYLSLLLISFYE